MSFEGERVRLCPVEPADFDKLVQWANDPEVNRFTHGDYPATNEECLAWHRRVRENRQKQYHGITLKDGTLIGDVELDHIAWRSGDAELRIRIGERDYWDRGYGTDAVMCLLRHAFLKMNLARVYLRVYSWNGRAIRCYEKCGFKKEGRLVRRDAVPPYREIVLMRVTRDEFVGLGAKQATG
ncbi:MAG: GNAT family N-acetyltransferase [Firmicutes bacterium]|nr:GNAT family N-acetyltransferase [Bacillota bacterium]